RGVIVAIIVVAVVVVLAGGVLALRFAHRSDRAGAVPGELARPSDAAATATEPSIDETIADLEARLAPQPDVVPDLTPLATPEELEQLLEEPVREKPRLRDRLGRTRAALAGAFGGLRGRSIDDDTWDDLEEAMLLADVGLATTQRILEAVRARAKDDKITDGSGLVDLVQDEV